MPLLKCVDGRHAPSAMVEVHEGVCGSHIGGQSLATKILQVGYYWSTMRNKCLEYVKRCEKC